MTNALKELFARAETWPEEVQEEAVESLRVIEHIHSGTYRLTKEDKEALKRSAEDVRRKRFVPEKKLHKFFKTGRA